MSGLLLLAATIPLASASNWDALNNSQHEELLKGRSLLVEEEVKGNPWPRFTIYQLVKATPSQVAAVFWDCERDNEYIPNCAKVTAISRPAPGVVEAEYTLNMPFLLPDEVYLSRNEATRLPDGGYEIRWKVLHSRYTKNCSGKLTLEKHDGDTLIRYSNLVEPGSRIAGILKHTASRQVVESVQALVDRVGFLLIQPGGSLARQVKELEDGLGGAGPPAK